MRINSMDLRDDGTVYFLAVTRRTKWSCTKRALCFKIELLMSLSSSRREFLALTAASLIPANAAPAESHQATGVKVGEISPDSALIWTRRTKSSLRALMARAVRRAVALPSEPTRRSSKAPARDGRRMRVIVIHRLRQEGRATEWSAVGAAERISPASSRSGTDAGYRLQVHSRNASLVEDRRLSVGRLPYRPAAKTPAPPSTSPC